MISKNDLYILLYDLNSRGIDTNEATNTLVSTQGTPIEVIKFINDNRQFDLASFYENIRRNYNKKKSPLYGNIVKDIEEPNSVLTTLSALLTQILLYSKNVENKQMFLRHARAEDITKILNIYFNTYDLTNCIKLLRIIKADLKAFESIKQTV